MGKMNWVSHNIKGFELKKNHLFIKNRLICKENLKCEKKSS